MSLALADSIRFCQSLARRTAKNFYWSFLTLPRPMRRDMCVLYAFMRVTDDLGDDDDAPLKERQSNLHVWRTMLQHLEIEPLANYDQLTAAARTVSGVVWDKDFAVFAHLAAGVLTALGDVIARRRIPVAWLHEVISGVESDLTQRTFATFADLEHYCYQVAGAVGLCCIQIWGFEGDDAPRHAIDCGTAFQLTNILRDLREDSARGRVYLPQAELSRFGVSPEELAAGVLTSKLRSFLEFQVDRAHDYYASAAKLLPKLSRPGRRVQSAMLGIYGGLLREIERRGCDVFASRVELTKAQKLWTVARACCRPDSVAAEWKTNRPSPHGVENPEGSR